LLGLITFGAFSLLLIWPWRWINPPTSAFMLRMQLSGKSYEYQWVDWSSISPHLPVAVVAAEDQRFPHHGGFDFDEIAVAIEEHKAKKRFRGASTISQQVAKNLFLWSGPSYVRKAIEAYLTVWIEMLWSKKRILEVYMNIAQFGPQVFGAEMASRKYFDRGAASLTKRQAARLAVILPNPYQLKVRPASKYMRQRTATIEKQMRLLGGSNYLRGLR
jgi:monofunctional biosynthetic peptidoglycan transglycosylase